MLAPTLRERDLGLERRLTRLAAAANGDVDPETGEGDDGGLTLYAHTRAHPGGVRQRNFSIEAAEELADARNYLVWRIEAIYTAFLAGDPLACDEYERHMRALRYVVLAWRELHTESA